LNVPNVAVERDVEPLFCNVVVEGLEICDSFGLVVQLAWLHPDRSHVCCGLSLLRLQFDNISGPNVSENAAISNGFGDLVEAALESTHSTHSDEVHGCAASVPVIDGSH
jgi:hypothetical protein